MLLHHLTLNTGHSSTHRLDTLDAGVVAALSPLVRSGGGIIPAVAPWRCVIAGGADAGAATFDFRRGQSDGPAVFCGLAWTDAGADELWPAMLSMWEPLRSILAPQAPPPRRPGRLPWLACILLPAAALATSREDLGWMGDAEKCFAAAILEEWA